MIEIVFHQAAMFAIAAALGVYFGSRNSYWGDPAPSAFHAMCAFFGLFVTGVISPDADIVAECLVIATLLSFALALTLARVLRASERVRRLAGVASIDAWPVAASLSVGCACGVGSVRAIIAVVLFFIVANFLRPVQATYASKEAMARADWPVSPARKVLLDMPQQAIARDGGAVLAALSNARIYALPPLVADAPQISPAEEPATMKLAA